MEDPKRRRFRRRDRSRGLWRPALAAIGPNRPLLIALSAFSLLAGVAEGIALYLVALLAVGLGRGSDEATVSIGPVLELDLSLEAVVGVAAITLVLLLVLSLPVAHFSGRLSKRTLIRCRTRLMEAYLQSPWAARAGLPEGHLQHLMGEYCARNERLVEQTSTAVTASFSITALALAAFAAAPQGAAVGGVMAIGMSRLMRPLSRRIRASSLAMAKVTSQMASRVAQTARLGEEIAAFHVEHRVEQWVAVDIERSGATVERIRFAGRAMPLLYQVGALGIVTLLAYALVLSDPGEVQALAPVLLLFVRILGYGKQLQYAMRAGEELAPYVDGLEAEIQLLARHGSHRGHVDVAHVIEVRLVDVSFEYTPGQPVLHGVNLVIRRGECLGVVGPSGSGKTTLTQILLRLRVPTGGLVCAGDVPLRDITQACWSRLVGFVPQGNQLLRGSVADNIRFYRPEFSLDEVVRAARSAHIHDEISSMPDGYETEIGPGARDLSGGQCQRLGIARALLAHPELLILDEPTSALDQQSESLIRQTLAELRPTTTLVVISHRPAALAVCDRVVRLQGGVLEEIPVTAG